MRCMPVLLIAFLILCTPATAAVKLLPFCQTETGVIRGSALDPQGAVISGAEVRATNIRTSQAFATKTDDTGAFVLTDVPYGDYAVLITSPGFAAYRTPVTLSRETSEAPHNATMQVTLGEVRIDAHMNPFGSGELGCVVCS